MVNLYKITDLVYIIACNSSSLNKCVQGLRYDLIQEFNLWRELNLVITEYMDNKSNPQIHISVPTICNFLEILICYRDTHNRYAMSVIRHLLNYKMIHLLHYGIIINNLDLIKNNLWKYDSRINHHEILSLT